MISDLILLGPAGHCRSCIEVIVQEVKYRIAGIVDKAEAKTSKRGSGPDFNRFLHIAKGSAAELRTQLIFYILYALRPMLHASLQSGIVFSKRDSKFIMYYFSVLQQFLADFLEKVSAKRQKRAFFKV